MRWFGRKKEISDSSSEADAYREHGRPILEAVTQVMICGSWEELLAVFTRYSDELESGEVDNVIDALREALKEDQYAIALVSERADLIELHRKKGIIAVLRHPAMKLGEPTEPLRLLARVGRLKSVAEAEAAAPDILTLLLRK